MLIVLLVGLPGSGKSYWLEQNRLPSLSSDDMRVVLTGDVTNQANNRLIFSTLRTLCAARLQAGAAVTYIDSTALALWERRSWIRFAELHGCDIECVFFDVPLEECQRRNAARHRVVPDEAMRRMAARLVPPSVDEGFRRVTVPREAQSP